MARCVDPCHRSGRNGRSRALGSIAARTGADPNGQDVRTPAGSSQLRYSEDGPAEVCATARRDRSPPVGRRPASPVCRLEHASRTSSPTRAAEGHASRGWRDGSESIGVHCKFRKSGCCRSGRTRAGSGRSPSRCPFGVHGALCTAAGTSDPAVGIVPHAVCNQPAAATAAASGAEPYPRRHCLHCRRIPRASAAQHCCDEPGLFGCRPAAGPARTRSPAAQRLRCDASGKASEAPQRTEPPSLPPRC